jgi:hypothetical protein
MVVRAPGQAACGGVGIKVPRVAGLSERRVCWLSYQHLEAAYAENQEVQSDLVLMRARGVEIPAAILRQADRLGGLIYGLLRAELRGKDR